MNGLIPPLKRLTKTDIAAIALLSAGFLFLTISAFFDGTVPDEAFYSTIPLRIISGDGLFTDEWHLSQLSGVLLYIPVLLFTKITGGTEGIILFMRLLFCLMQASAGAVLYITFRKEKISAVIISFSFILFSVIGLNTLSYNTMGLALFVLLICTAYSVTTEPSAIKMCLSGTLIAMFILCQPLGAIFYITYFLAVCIFAAKKSAVKDSVPFPLRFRSFLMTVAGILPVFIFFLYILLKNSGIKNILRSIPGILSDVEHMTVSETLGIETFSLFQFFADMAMAAGAAALIILAVFAVASVILNRFRHPAGILLYSSALLIFMVFLFLRLLNVIEQGETDDVSFFYLPLALSGLPFFLMCRKKNIKVFCLMWCPGIIYAVFMTVTSNLGLHASVNGYIVASFATFIFIKDIICGLNTKDIKHGAPVSRIYALICLAAASVVLLSPAVSFMISRTQYKSTLLQNGAYKGISLPSDQALINFRLYSDAKRIKEKINSDDRVFVIENTPVVYIDGEFLMGAHSGWFIAEQLAFPEVRDRFRSYYEINPENIPDYLYVPSYFYSKSGLEIISAKKMAEFGYALFECEKPEDIGNGLLIKVTGIKNE